MAINPDELEPKKPKELKPDLSLMSVGELGERIATLEEEIAKCKAMIEKKQASRSSADMVFKKS